MSDISRVKKCTRIAEWLKTQFTRTPRAEPMPPQIFGERLRGIYSIREAESVLNEYLASIQIDDDDPGFLFDWQIDNVNAFVREANRLERERRARDEARRQGVQDQAAQDHAGQGQADQDQANRLGGAIQAPDQAPRWLRVRPPEMTSGSFVEDLVSFLEREPGGRCGYVLLAPNDMRQYGRIMTTLVALQDDAFLQEAMEAAFPVANRIEQHLVVTYHLTDSRAQRMHPNDLAPARVNGNALHRLFI